MKPRLRRAGDLILITGGERVVLMRLLREGLKDGRERWLARHEDGKELLVLVEPTTGSKAK